jgi:hypothetical protein
VGGLYRDQGLEVVRKWLTSLLQPHVEDVYRTMREDYLPAPLETEAVSQLEAPASFGSSLLSSTSLEGAGPVLPSHLAGGSHDHHRLTALQAYAPLQSSAQAGDGVGTRRAVARGKRKRQCSSPNDGRSGETGEQGTHSEEGIIKMIILNKRVASDFVIRRC